MRACSYGTHCSEERSNELVSAYSDRAGMVGERRQLQGSEWIVPWKGKETLIVSSGVASCLLNLKQCLAVSVSVELSHCKGKENQAYVADSRTHNLKFRPGP